MALRDKLTLNGSPDEPPLSDVEKKRVLVRAVGNTLAFILLLAAVFTVGALLYQVQVLTEIAEANRERGIENQRLLETAERNTDILIDCTTPGGECLARGQAGQMEAVNNINEITILAASCARVPENDTEAEIRTCIEAGLND